MAVTDGMLTCSGNYDALDMSVTITMQVPGSDGRAAFIVASRRANGTPGHGIVRRNDGSSADFVFGKAAQNFYASHLASPLRHRDDSNGRAGLSWPRRCPVTLAPSMAGRAELV